MSSPNPNESLSRTLDDWRAMPRRNPQFRVEVWARIETARRLPSWPGYLRAHGALVVGALAVAVLLGAWSGREQARERDAMARTALIADYVHGLDARWMRAP